MLNDAFALAKPDEQTEQLYNSLSGITYAESILEENEDKKEALKEEVFDAFGIEVNMDDFDDSPEGFAAFRERLKQKIEQQQQNQGKTTKSKKQLKKETGLQQQQEIRQRTMRSIYMGLVKLLHPDKETDEVVKKEKEEIMKTLTRAYGEKDLTTLLQLELKWIAKENDHLDKLPDDTLKIYIAVLKAQVKELEFEHATQINNPAFAAVAQLINMTDNFAINAISQEKNSLTRYTSQMKAHSKSLKGGKIRAAIRDCVEFYAVIVDDDDTDFFR
ncbi:MAG: hypothetical protein ABIU63_03695 [Chitinophagaceae bacterium]